VDETIIFHNLTREELRKIVDLQLKDLRKRLADQEIKIEVTDAAKELLLEMGYDPAFGARPLKRTIQREVQNPLATLILEGKFPPGATVKVGVNKKKEFTFE